MFMDLVSYLGNSLRLFLGGRSLGSDINAAKSMGLQPLRPKCFWHLFMGQHTTRVALFAPRCHTFRVAPACRGQASSAQRKMFSEAVLDHFRRPRNAGELPDATTSVEVTNPVCGDVLKLAARVENSRFAEVRFLCRGCTTAIACASFLTE